MVLSDKIIQQINTKHLGENEQISGHTKKNETTKQVFFAMETNTHDKYTRQTKSIGDDQNTD